MQCRRTRFNSWVRKIRWRRDRLPTPVFLGFPCGALSAGSCDRRTERGREEPPYVRSQGQKSREDPMPEGQWPRGVTPSPRSGAAAESARLRWRRNCREELPCVPGQRRRLGGDTLHLRPGAAAERSHPMSEARGCGREELSCVGDQGRLGGVTLCPRPGVVARRSNRTSKEQWLHGHRRA